VCIADHTSGGIWCGLCWLNSTFRLYGCELFLTAVIILYQLLFVPTCFRRCFKLLLLCAFRFHVQNPTRKPQNFLCGKSWAEYGHFWSINILQHAIYGCREIVAGVFSGNSKTAHNCDWYCEFFTYLSTFITHFNYYQCAMKTDVSCPFVNSVSNVNGVV